LQGRSRCVAGMPQKSTLISRPKTAASGMPPPFGFATYWTFGVT